MRNIIVLVVFLGSFNSNGFSQEKTNEDPTGKEFVNLSPDEKADKRTEKMTEMLDLSDDQATEVKAINLSHAKKMDRIRIEIKILKDQAKLEREKTRTDIDSVLNEDQRQKMKDQVDKRREERKKRKRLPRK
jgi:periplasmic protein CpxP/Spy